MQRKRLPRYIGPDKTVRPYDEKLATGQLIFKSLDIKFELEWLQNVFEVKGGYVIVSDKHIIFANSTNNIVWEFPSRAIRGLQLKHTHIVVVTIAGEVKQIYSADGNTNTQEEIYKNLVICLDKCRNDRHFKQL